MVGYYVYLSTSVTSPLFWQKSEPIFVHSTCCIPMVLAEGYDTGEPQIAQLRFALRFQCHQYSLHCAENSSLIIKLCI